MHGFSMDLLSFMIIRMRAMQAVPASGPIWSYARTEPECIGCELVPDGLESDFATDQISQGKTIEMPHERLDPVCQYMAQAADRGDDARVVRFVETFHETTGIFETADDLADIYCIGRLAQQQSAAAAADAVDKAFGYQPPGNFHQVVFRNAELRGNFGDRVMAFMCRQIHQSPEGIVGVNG